MAAEARWGRLVLWRLLAAYALGVVIGVVVTMLYDDSTAVNTSIARFGQVRLLLQDVVCTIL